MKNLLLITLFSLFVSCAQEARNVSADPAPGTSTTTTTTTLLNQQMITLELDVSELERQVGQHYEGWLIVNGSVETSGRFNITKDGKVAEVNKDGEIVKLLGDKFMKQLPLSYKASSMFVLTIEPNGDEDEGASNVHIVAGAFSNKKAVATTDHSAALGESFSDSSGTFLLGTPSNGDADTQNQGIWYLEVSAGSPVASLNLPKLNGWVYEGWIVNVDEGTVNSTGTFETASEQDSNKAGGVKAGLISDGPSFPGEDFINPAIELNEGKHMAVITIEPENDLDPRPSSMKLLRKMIPEGVADHESINMDLFDKEGFPTVQAILK